ncbi:MAG: uracil-DNA glycosylase, partial [Armatimonadota bacterium]|nr:uracil-DNA glycosylase [Armatimonadota bacterium]
MIPPFPRSWQPIVGDERQTSYFKKLEQFLDAERQEHTIYPPQNEIFTALDLTPYDEVKVFILGQDPYHGEGQAHGLAFSVRPGVPPPPSLLNIFRELRNDLGCRIPNNGYLVPWAKQGVLLLNAVLTVRANSPNSHKNKGWEKFTDEVIRQVNEKDDPIVFVLWGGYAAKKLSLIDTERHTIIRSAHPSPLSARSGFFG